MLGRLQAEEEGEEEDRPEHLRRAPVPEAPLHLPGLHLHLLGLELPPPSQCLWDASATRESASP